MSARIERQIRSAVPNEYRCLRDALVLSSEGSKRHANRDACGFWATAAIGGWQGMEHLFSLKIRGSRDGSTAGRVVNFSFGRSFARAEARETPADEA
jgi:hypothetical protein